MVQVPRRTGVSGPALVRLLTRLAHADISESGQSLADRLSLWLGWTDAIALSAVLDSGAQAAPAGAPASDSAEEDECARLRAALADAIDDDGTRARAPILRRGQPVVRETPPDTGTDYAPHRQRYLTLQQTMETRIGQLRSRLRAILAGMPGMARLAMMDAVMDRSLGAHERRLLATVPALLESHFARLRQAAQDAPDEPAAAAPAQWLATFRQDMRSVLLAELDIRLQPVEGLLAALRDRP
ncbi:DUF3348 domain-containing protein [Bordetella petrii]|uniref:DUF3348 domain-containing protein n=1 Tax=Bordetella petrii TaxID=94624 RepID=UPI00048B169B|nr:DUF3348 domain-containing protein [Bordetella petrii]